MKGEQGRDLTMMAMMTRFVLVDGVVSRGIEIKTKGKQKKEKKIEKKNHLIKINKVSTNKSLTHHSLSWCSLAKKNVYDKVILYKDCYS